MCEPFPDFLLADTLWDFADQDEYEYRDAFEETVRQYHIDVHEYAPEITADECWRPTDVALRTPRVAVRYFTDAGNDVLEWYEVELTSDNGTEFTNGELLFKLHNAAVDRLRTNYHHWFEGLELESETTAGVPVYLLCLGS